MLIDPFNTNRLTSTIIGCAIRVHRGTGPGLLESVYGPCRESHLTQRTILPPGWMHPCRRTGPFEQASTRYTGCRTPASNEWKCLLRGLCARLVFSALYASTASCRLSFRLSSPFVSVPSVPSF